jgi:hypothetical protein
MKIRVGELPGIGQYYRKPDTAILLGVAFANLLRGVPIDANMNYVGTFFDLLNPYALLGGLTTC